MPFLSLNKLNLAQRKNFIRRALQPRCPMPLHSFRTMAPDTVQQTRPGTQDSALAGARSSRC